MYGTSKCVCPPWGTLCSFRTCVQPSLSLAFEDKKKVKGIKKNFGRERGRREEGKEGEKEGKKERSKEGKKK